MNLVDIYYGFQRRLRYAGLREKLCRLALDGRCEAWVTGELFNHIVAFERHGMTCFQNMGKHSRRDLVIVKNRKITHLLELKQVKNRHRAGVDNAFDDVGTQVAELARQLEWGDGEQAGRNFSELSLSGRCSRPLGILIATYTGTRDTANEDLAYSHSGETKFFQHVRSRMKAHRLVFYDQPTPGLGEVFTKRKIRFANDTWMVTVKTSLCVVKS